MTLRRTVRDDVRRRSLVPIMLLMLLLSSPLLSSPLPLSLLPLLLLLLTPSTGLPSSPTAAKIAPSRDPRSASRRRRETEIVTRHEVVPKQATEAARDRRSSRKV